MNLTLSPDQLRAFDAIGHWMTTPQQAFVLGGYAGSGKTTIMRPVIESVDRVVCATPTGKAASVLSSKLEGLGIEVGTIHSLLYRPIEVTEMDVADAEGEVADLRDLGMEWRGAAKRLAKLIKLLETGGCHFGFKRDPKHQPLVIVDEASMVGDDLERDLRAIASKILFVGDPGQLAPVNGTEFFSRNRPDFVLEKIHRQAADSTILRFANAIRHGEKFTDWNQTDCVLASEGDLAALRDADQVLTGKNVVRRRINTALREGRGFSGKYPNKGEKVICLRNDHGRKLINGVQGILTTDTEVDSFGELTMTMKYEDRLMRDMKIDELAFAQYARPNLTRRDMAKNGKAEFDFGHCITVHKSQGSEWDHVAVYDDKMRSQDTANRARWIYTAATRAAKKLTWVNGG